ncbi:hypothetical protein LPU83_pLPU83d_0784 (plasmid) [Rhizobium favelukesii]|uniref:Uncharacterized protein n=1 Tax=Rhizobium favelukesii TaxID=348824 RepID=W6RN09_9HYPH|nr:hypothetical protein LPU83_pLPU83d_0784 [Rhizobium favelukesii]
MNCTFFSVLSTSLSTDLATTYTLERIVAISGGRLQRRPRTPASASSNCWKRFDTDRTTIRRNLFGGHADGAASLMVRAKIMPRHDGARRNLRLNSMSLGMNVPAPATGCALTSAPRS